MCLKTLKKPSDRSVALVPPDVCEMCQFYSKLSILLKFRFESHCYIHVRRTQRFLTVSDFKRKYFHINTVFEFSSFVYQFEAFYFVPCMFGSILIFGLLNIANG